MKIIKSILLIIIDLLAVFTGFTIASLVCGITGSDVALLDIRQKLALSLAGCVTGCIFADFSSDPDRSAVMDIVGITVAFAAMSLIANFLFSSSVLSYLIYYLIVYAWMLLIGIFSKLLIRGNSSYDDEEYDDDDDDDDDAEDFSQADVSPPVDEKKTSPIKHLFTKNKVLSENTPAAEADDPFGETGLTQEDDPKESEAPDEADDTTAPHEQIDNKEYYKKLADVPAEETEEELSFINEYNSNNDITNNTDAAEFFANSGSIRIESGFIPIEAEDILELKPLNEKIEPVTEKTPAIEEVDDLREKNEAAPVQTLYSVEESIISGEEEKPNEPEKTEPSPEGVSSSYVKQLSEAPVKAPNDTEAPDAPLPATKEPKAEYLTEEPKENAKADETPPAKIEEVLTPVPLAQSERTTPLQKTPILQETESTAPLPEEVPQEKEKTVYEEDGSSFETNQREEMTQQDQLLLERLLRQLDERDRQIQELEKVIRQKESAPREEMPQRAAAPANAYGYINQRDSYIERNKREILDSILDDVKNMYSNLSSRERIVEDREYSLLLKMAEMGSRERLSAVRDNSPRKSEMNFTPSDDPTLAGDIRDIIEAYKHSAEQSLERVKETSRTRETPSTPSYHTANTPPYGKKEPYRDYREPASAFYETEPKPNYYEQPNEAYMQKETLPPYRTEQHYYAPEVRQQPYYAQPDPFAAKNEPAYAYRENASYYAEAEPNYYREADAYTPPKKPDRIDRAEVPIRPEYDPYEQHNRTTDYRAAERTEIRPQATEAKEFTNREKETPRKAMKPFFEEQPFVNAAPNVNENHYYTTPAETKAPYFIPAADSEKANGYATPEKQAEAPDPKQSAPDTQETPKNVTEEAHETIPVKPTVEKADIIETTITLNGFADPTDTPTDNKELTKTADITEKNAPAVASENIAATQEAVTAASPIAQAISLPAAEKAKTQATKETVLPVIEEKEISQPVSLPGKETSAEQTFNEGTFSIEKEAPGDTEEALIEHATEIGTETSPKADEEKEQLTEEEPLNTPAAEEAAPSESITKPQAGKGPDFEELEVKDFIIAPYRTGEADPTKAQRKRNTLNLPTMSEPRIRPAESKMRIQFKAVTPTNTAPRAEAAKENSHPTSFAEAKAIVIAQEKAKAEAEAKARAEAERLKAIEAEKARKLAEDAAKALAIAKAREAARRKAEEEQRQKLLAQQKAREEEIQRIKAEEERKAAELKQKQEEQRAKAAEEERQKQLAMQRAREKLEAEERQRAEEEKAKAEAMAKAIEEEKKRQAEIALTKAKLEAEERQRAEAERARAIAEAKADEEEKRRRQAAEEALTLAKAEAEANRLREEEAQKAKNLALERQRALETEKKRLEDEANTRQAAIDKEAAKANEQDDFSFPIDIGEDDFFDSDLPLHNHGKILTELDNIPAKPQKKVEKIDFETVPSLNRNSVNFKDTESSKIGLMANELADISDLLDDM